MSAVLDLASPTACAARTARMAAAAQAHTIRHASLTAARAVVRKFGTRNEWELLAAIQNATQSVPAAAFGRLAEYAERFRELTREITAEMEAGEPELAVYGNERGEVDAHSRGASYG